MRVLVFCSVLVGLVCCVGGPTGDLPTVAAPTIPLPTQTTAEQLTAVGPTTLVGEPGSSTLVQVRATTASGKPVIGAILAFQVQTGGGATDPVVTASAADGIASAKWTYGPVPGVNLLKVSGGAAAAIPVSFTASTVAATSNRSP